MVIGSSLLYLSGPKIGRGDGTLLSMGSISILFSSNSNKIAE